MKITNVDDYIDKVAEKYDKIPKDVLKKVINYGLRSYYRINLMGGDILLKSPYFTAYTGKLYAPDKEYYFGRYKKIKKRIKYRIQYARKQIKYNGYYYFGMSEEQYKSYKEYFNNPGRKGEAVKFERLYIYKLFDEVFDVSCCTRFFRIEIPEERGFRLWFNELKTNKFDYIGKKVDKKFIPVDYEKGNK